MVEETECNPWLWEAALADSGHFSPAASGRKGAFTCDGLRMVNNDHIGDLFLAASEAVEEAIINALVAATTTEGNGHTVNGLDAATLLKALRQAGWPGAEQGDLI